MSYRLCRHLRPLLPRDFRLRVFVALSYHWNRYSSVASEREALLPPRQDGSEKEYSAKIRQLVDDISKLTVLEVSDLNELLKVSNVKYYIN